jgi:hypothetical protein
LISVSLSRNDGAVVKGWFIPAVFLEVALVCFVLSLLLPIPGSPVVGAASSI